MQLQTELQMKSTPKQPSCKKSAALKKATVKKDMKSKGDGQEMAVMVGQWQKL